MKHRILPAICCVSLAALAACTSGGAARVEPSHVAVYDKTRSCEVDRPEAPGLAVKFKDSETRDARRRPGSIDLSCFRFKKSDPQGKAYADAEKTKVGRNRLANAIIMQSDSVCGVEKALMLERQAEVNGWLSIAATGLSVTSSIVTGDLASNILAGGSAFASASRDHVNAHVYRNQIIQTITSAIDGKRALKLTEIEQNLAKETGDYSIDQAIREINQYHQLCSFGVGLQTVMEAVEKQQQFEETLKIYAMEQELDRLRRTKGDPALIKALEARIVEAKTGVGLSSVPEKSAAPVEPTEPAEPTEPQEEQPE